MKLCSLLTFLFVFTIEVRVRAFDTVNEKIIETPENCLESYDYCIIKSLKNKFSYKGQSHLISMAPESILIRQKEKELSFVKGQLFVKTESKITLDIPYGQIEIDKNSQVLLERFSDKVLVQTIFGKSYLKPLGEKKPILVMEGHENYLSQVNETQKAQTGIPKPIIIDQLLKTWAYHTDLSKVKFLESVRSFKDVHETAVRDLSILNEQIASREIASVKAEKLADEERLKKAKEHKDKLQKSYYERLLGE